MTQLEAEQKCSQLTKALTSASVEVNGLALVAILKAAAAGRPEYAHSLAQMVLDGLTKAGWLADGMVGNMKLAATISPAVQIEIQPKCSLEKFLSVMPAAVTKDAAQVVIAPPPPITIHVHTRGAKKIDIERNRDTGIMTGAKVTEEKPVVYTTEV